MLGQVIYDPHHTESDFPETAGLGLLPVRTTFADWKQTYQVQALCRPFPFMGETLEARDLTGYEIHMGQTVVDSGASEPFVVCQRSGKDCSLTAGTAREDGLVFGTYIHGLFDNDRFRREMLNILRRHKGLAPLPAQRNYKAEKERSYDRLAAVTAHHLDMDKLLRIMSDSGL